MYGRKVINVFEKLLAKAHVERGFLRFGDGSGLAQIAGFPGHRNLHLNSIF